MTRKPYLLYADDDVSTQLYISKFLQNNYELQCLNNFALDCLESISRRRPDLIILGSCMNLYKHYETHEVIRAKNDYQSIPIISIDSKLEESEKDKNLSLPVSSEHLQETIQLLL